MSAPSSITTERVQRLMHRCRIGYPAYKKLDEVLVECYYVLGELVKERDALKAEKLPVPPGT